MGNPVTQAKIRQLRHHMSRQYKFCIRLGQKVLIVQNRCLKNPKPPFCDGCHYNKEK